MYKQLFLVSNVSISAHCCGLKKKNSHGFSLKTNNINFTIKNNKIEVFVCRKHIFHVLNRLVEWFQDF